MHGREKRKQETKYSSQNEEFGVKCEELRNVPLDIGEIEKSKDARFPISPSSSLPLY